VSEFTEQIKEKIRARMDELRPMIEEAEQLEAMLDAMDPHREQAPRIRPADQPQLQTQQRGWGGAQRIPQNERLEQFLSVARAQPTLSVAAVAQKLGVSANRGYQLVTELERQGRLERTFNGFVVHEEAAPPALEQPVDPKTRVMRLVSRRPMISGRDLANALDISQERVFAITSELESEGKLTRIDGSFLAAAQ
jgi:Mn-dependent DtxR family transcriptional regulator